MPLEIAADLVGDLVDLPLGLLQSSLGLRGPRGSAAFLPGRFMACSLCPSRSLKPAHDPVAPSAARCSDMPDTRPRPVYAHPDARGTGTEQEMRLSAGVLKLTLIAIRREHNCSRVDGGWHLLLS